MGNLLNPYRLPGGPENEARFIAPLYRPFTHGYYSKVIDINDDAAGSTGLVANRTFAATMVWRVSGTLVNYPRIMEFTKNSWDDATIFCNFGQTTGTFSLGVRGHDPSMQVWNILTAMQAHTGKSNFCDGLLYRFAANVDLDDLANSWFSINGVKYTDLSASTAAANTIDWAYPTKLGIGTHPLSASSSPFETFANDDGFAMVSLHYENNLNFDALYDGSGYFTNPGKHWLNWYGTRPWVAFINAPYVNQGTCHWLSGRNFHHDPCHTWDYENTSEAREMKVIQTPGTASDVNEGVIY